jgi:signal transduction histidine kinase
MRHRLYSGVGGRSCEAPPTRLSNTICHEIRNPLNVIYGTLTLLRDKVADIEEMFKKQVSQFDSTTATIFHETLTKIKEDINTLEQCSQQ